MTSSQQPLVDTAARARNVARALRMGGDLFLQNAAIDEIKDRLEIVNKSFTKMAIVTDFSQLWADAFPEADIVPAQDRLEFTQADYDLIIHGMSLHWSNDPVGQLIQCHRSMRPDGLFLGVLLGGETLATLRTCLAEAEATLRGGLSPRLLPMGEVRQLGHLLQRASFAMPVADQVTLTASYADTRHLMRDLRNMGEGNALTDRARQFTRRAIFDMCQDLYTQKDARADGRLNATFELVVLTGWTPHASQPKPLRPGSATTHLSEVLGKSDAPTKD